MASRKIHRWTDPTYPLEAGETFPGTIGGDAYDRINIGSGGAGGSPADGQKVGGNFPNTYLVDFEEDARATAANRGLRALAENTDTLDDILRASVPARATQSWAGAAAFLSLAPQNVFVGKSGETVPLAPELVQIIVTSTGLPAVSAGGATIVATDVVDDTSLSSIRGTPSSGFSNNARVVWNATVPAGTYTVIYGSRVSLARLAETRPREFLRAVLLGERISALVLSLQQHGLNERYRRSNQVVAGTPNLAGDGAAVTVDGAAVTFRGTVAADSARRDVHDAVLTVDHTSYFAPNTSATDAALFAQFLLTDGRDGSAGVAGMSSPATGGTVWAAARPAITPIAANRNTAVDFGAATLNPSGTADQIQVGASARFWRSSGGLNLSTIRLGFDLMKVVRASGATEVYVIQALNANNRIASLRRLNGSTPTFPSSEAVTAYLIQPYTTIGQGIQSGNRLGQLVISQLPDSREATDDTSARTTPFTVLAPRVQRGTEIPGSVQDDAVKTAVAYRDYVAIQFGGWDTARSGDQAFQPVITAGVYGNGRIWSNEYVHAGFRRKVAEQEITDSTTWAQTITFTNTATGYDVRVQQDAPGSLTVAVAASAIRAGMQLSLTLRLPYPQLARGRVEMVWPGACLFTSGSSEVPDNFAGVVEWLMYITVTGDILVRQNLYPLA